MTVEQKTGWIEADKTRLEHQRAGTLCPVGAPMLDASVDSHQPPDVPTAQAGPCKSRPGPRLLVLVHRRKKQSQGALTGTLPGLLNSVSLRCASKLPTLS